MATRLILLKNPKKPKKSASITTMENYLRKVKEVQKENAKRKAEAKKKDGLYEKIRRG